MTYHHEGGGGSQLRISTGVHATGGTHAQTD